MSTIQNRPTTFKTGFCTHRRSANHKTICELFHGFHNRPATGGRIRFNLSRGRPRSYEGVILIPCTKTITAEETGRLLLENLYKRFGLPDKIISDRGPQFASKAFVELMKLLGIKSALSTAYHPQTDGTTERVNQEIEAYLAIYCASHPEEWSKAIHTMEFTHNNRRHADREKTPFELMFGDSPIAIPYSFENTKFPIVEDKMKTLIKNREEALAAHELARTRIAERRRSTFIPFKKGDKVW